jgi:transposase
VATDLGEGHLDRPTANEPTQDVDGVGLEIGLPAHLPRVEVVIEPAASTCPCCRSTMVVIGADISGRLDVIPAQYQVLVTKRPTLACRACEGVVVQAPAPERLIPGGLPTEATVSHVLVSRYADHLLLYRQSQIRIPPVRAVFPAHEVSFDLTDVLSSAVKGRAWVGIWRSSPGLSVADGGGLLTSCGFWRSWTNPASSSTTSRAGTT